MEEGNTDKAPRHQGPTLPQGQTGALLPSSTVIYVMLTDCPFVVAQKDMWSAL